MVPTLEKIYRYKKDELHSQKRKVSLQDIKLKVEDTEESREFLSYFTNTGLNLITEIKKASPSAGLIRENFNPIDIAMIYADNGSKALSVLTDENFFKGHLSFISDIKSKVKLPCLRKDFIFDEYQLFESRAAQADAVLLIVAMLDDIQLKDYKQIAEGLGMTVLIEVHDEEEINRVKKLSPNLIGVNNRNLKTMNVDLRTSETLYANLPENSCKISESGIKSHDDLIHLQSKGYDGFLIGETLMREKDLGLKLRELLGMI